MSTGDPMNAPRIWDPASRSIWEALNSGNLQLLADMLYSDDRFSSPEAIARLLIEANQRRKTVHAPDPMYHKQMMQRDAHQGERIEILEKLAKDLYYAISDVYENVEQHVDVSADGDQPNWAMSAIQVWEPLLERAQAVLGLKK